MKRLLRYLAHHHGRALGMFKDHCHPSGEEWADILRKHGGLHAMGDHCSIQTNVKITDPAYVSIGSNVRMSGCTLFGHDGSINMLNRAFGLKLDSVGSIVIGDNVFIGHGAIVLPGARIGSNSIVGAGTVVRGRLLGNAVYVGSDARPVRSIEAAVQRATTRHESYPWRHLVEQRSEAFDPSIEPELVRRRVEHFFREVA